MYAGEPARAIEVLASSIRLGPFQPIISSGFMGLAHYMLKRYGEAVRLCREFAARVPNYQWSHVWLASAYAQSGQLERARAEAAEVMRINPGFTIESAKRVIVYKDPEDVEHRLDGMRKAGLPEA
jgi:tetratricopeptide (TPR) repeat protein